MEKILFKTHKFSREHHQFYGTGSRTPSPFPKYTVVYYFQYDHVAYYVIVIAYYQSGIISSLKITKVLYFEIQGEKACEIKIILTSLKKQDNIFLMCLKPEYNKNVINIRFTEYNFE